MIRGTRLDLLKVTETNQQNESNVSAERELTTCKVHKRTNDIISLLLSPIIASIIKILIINQ